MTSDMLSLHIKIVCIFKWMLLLCVYAASIPVQARFSIGSIMDTVLPAITPIATGNNRCEALKSLFGLTYNQMQEKNHSNINDALDIDLITKNGNVKFNLTLNKRLNKLLASSETLVILVHGFMESSDGYMVTGLTPGLLKQHGIKILALDGRRIINLEYFRSSTYARFMGERLGTFLEELVRGGHNSSKIILIGHSLGAHIAGIAGKRLHQLTQQMVSRLIALDPAGPCFGNIDESGRLGREDAHYVMVVHTNLGVLGLREPVGHTDWYPNGGASQPGCYLSTCSHSRAWELFAEALVAPDHFPARKCENWTMFQNGLCSKNEVAYLTLNSKPPSSGAYFFTTTSSAPYGLGATGSG